MRNMRLLGRGGAIRYGNAVFYVGEDGYLRLTGMDQKEWEERKQ